MNALFITRDTPRRPKLILESRLMSWRAGAPLVRRLLPTKAGRSLLNGNLYIVCAITNCVDEGASEASGTRHHPLVLVLQARHKRVHVLLLRLVALRRKKISVLGVH